LSKKSEYIIDFVKKGSPSLPIDKLQQIQDQMSSINPFTFVPKSYLVSIVAGAGFNAFFTYGEERGWRDFMYKRLNKLFGEDSYWKHSIVLGSIWGLFHAPLILCGHNYPEHYVVGVAQMVLACILWSAQIKYFVDEAQKVEDEKYGPDSVDLRGIAGAMLHGVMNSTGSISMMFLKGGNDLTNGTAGAAGLITCSLELALLQFIRSRKQNK
jgi:hypothetical protein